MEATGAGGSPPAAEPASTEADDCAAQTGGMLSLLKTHLQVPLSDMVSQLAPLAESIQQDITQLHTSVQTTNTHAANEKAAVDEELQRLQELVAQFQQRMLAIMGHRL